MKKAMKLGAIAVTASMIFAGLSACGSSTQGNKTADGKTVIKIQTFNNFGYEKSTAAKPGADLFAEYEKLHPNIKIESTVASSSDEARTAFNSSISTGSNSYDIFAVDIAWWPSIRAIGNKFMDLKDYTKNNNWPDWVVKTGTDDSGRLIGAGTDIGPTALCYRQDLFEQAGLPTDREQVKELFGGENATWDKFFEIGQRYTQKTGKPFIDNLGDVAAAMKVQKEEVYVSKDDKVIATEDGIHDMYNLLTKNANLSAGVSTWSDDWNASFNSPNGFAVLTCPAWEVNNVKGNAGADFRGWNVADVFPGEAGTDQGGSWLTIPESSPVKEEAAKLVAWLTNPEQQSKVFVAASNFPSSPKAQATPEVADKTDDFLNNAPTGKIFANRAETIKHIPYINAKYYDIDSKFGAALDRVDCTKEQTPEESWKQFVEDVKALS
ncbi:ABC transporter substrate-binding protein [Alloscardovia macacae]|uniref:Sugar ABC transporter substrate-binding protein n=1 Tax=Alloscardovia macacae TaxID=1160091 RepID=A0A261F683_9BIFI|nr:ABC transporter substrate-binding protein [Alloscardovia macacae]OZG54659.1 sugar ABC transporter substrate-binding protein [Alloscardovia macacae]